MARLRILTHLAPLLLVLALSYLVSVEGDRSGRQGINSGKGVQAQQFRPEYRTGIGPVILTNATTPLTSYGRKLLRARKLLQDTSAGILSCDTLVGICGTLAADNGWTSGQYVQTGGGFGSGNGVSNTKAGDRGTGRANARGGRGGLRGGGISG